MLKVSIIMNCYNGEQYLKEALESIVKQTYKNWELIFWDNQSTDKSALIFKSYTDSRFKYYYAPIHTDLGEARKNAIEKTTGKWIAFLDVDDIWLPDKLSEQIKIINRFKDDNIGLVYGKTYVLEMNGKNKKYFIYQSYDRKLFEGHIFKDLLFKGDFIPFLTAIVNKKAYEEVGGFSSYLKFAPDYYLFILIAEKYIVKAVKKRIAIYRLHSDNYTKKISDIAFYEEIRILSSFVNDYPAIQKRITMIKFKYFLKKCTPPSLFNLFIFIKNYFFRKKKKISHPYYTSG